MVRSYFYAYNDIYILIVIYCLKVLHFSLFVLPSSVSFFLSLEYMIVGAEHVLNKKNFFFVKL